MTDSILVEKDNEELKMNSRLPDYFIVDTLTELCSLGHDVIELITPRCQYVKYVQRG